MRILLAPDSFKGSLSAVQACEAMARGIENALRGEAETVFIPLADGGEGTLEALLEGANGTRRTTRVQGPLGASVEASWGFLPDGTGVVEMAQASGLTLVPASARDALRASSFGTGQLIKAALDAGCRHILLGIGGSATTDGGAGALSALGVMLRDDNDVILPPGGGSLSRLASIDTRFADGRLERAQFTILCDVTNPLCGENGAAHIYGPQKGASHQDVETLDAALSHFSDVVAKTTGRDLRDTPGAGAAGGIGYGLMSFCQARLVPGIETVLDAADFDAKLRDADLVLTGEGAIDAQTLRGKTIAGVCRRAREADVPVLAFGGAVNLSGDEMNSLGLHSAFALPNAPLSLEECLSRAAELLETSVERALRVWNWNRKGAETQKEE